jgi:hypothetical protein
VRIKDVVEGRRRDDLRELYRFWSGAKPNGALRDEDLMRERVVAWMQDPAIVIERVGELGKRLGAVVERLVSAPRFQRRWQELSSSRSLSYLSSYDLEACVTALQRHGFAVETKDPRFNGRGARVIAMPTELGDGILRRRRERANGIFAQLTLRGHLEALYAAPERAGRTTPQRLRELYKMYSQEAACTSRIERLPEGIQRLVEKAILEFGGVLPRSLFERMETDLPHWNARRWRMILEQSLVGTVQELDLARFGLHHEDETLIVFNEVALAWFKRVAVPGDPDQPHEELSLGTDLPSNISRFLAYIQENDVRITVRGEIFKTTEKKIAQHLLPNPGRELDSEEVLDFLYRFCRREGLVDTSGERTLAVTAAGREWGSQELHDKQRALLDSAIEDPGPGGEPFHQSRLRQIFLRLLRRVEPGTWYDLMYLPFLARNTYLCQLEDLKIDEALTEHGQTGGAAAMVDSQRLAWNLTRWIRRRLYLIGLVDLGYDAASRPVALRVTPAFARLMGLDPGVAGERTFGVGALVVTPDFEVVLFPTGDDGELVHDLDRFCVREQRGSLRHFRITEESVRRALHEGMSLNRILGTLEGQSRTPVPQNVCFSIRDWGQRAGLMTLDHELTLRCEDPDTVRRFRQDPGTRTYVKRCQANGVILLKGRVTPKRMQSLLRGLGYIVELAGKPR